MSGASGSLIASSSRPLQLRMRGDLLSREQTFQGRAYWVVKDPLELKYFRFEEEEFFLLSQLDGKVTLDELRARFEKKFAPQKITKAELHQLTGLLYRSGLVISDAPGQGAQMVERLKERKGRELWSNLANLMSFRFRGVDPDRFLRWLDSTFGWIFSIPAFCASLLLMASALVLVLSQFDLFRARLPDFQQFFAPHNWFLLALTLGITKICHELGHGLSCKRFGGECHEMGLMLLVGTPCLYCNVTDSWMIPSKWKRAAIGAAGIYIELILASFATFIWWYAQAGIVSNVALNVMFVCSVSTLMFNANPLMRYDGYYILADLTEIPNLRQKGQTALERKAAKWLLGIEAPEDPFLPQRQQWLFASYTLASTCYGWLVSLSIFWFLYRVLEPYGLQIFGQMVALGMILSMIGIPIYRGWKFFSQPGRLETMDRWQATFSLSAIVATIGLVLLVPLPYYVCCSVQIQPRGATNVYVDVPGEIQQIHLQSGPVRAGETIVELDDVDIRAAVVQLENQQHDLETKLASLQARAHADETALLEMSQTEEALAAVITQIKQRRTEQARLVIRAPIDGELLPPPTKSNPPSHAKQLLNWHGRPLDIKNVGAFLPTSTLVGRIAQPGAWEATLVIEEQEIEFLDRDQPVDIFLEGFPGQKIKGQIDNISQEDVQETPISLSQKGGGNLATRTDAHGIEKLVHVSYQANVPLPECKLPLVAGLTGSGKIHAGYQSLAQRLWRLACHTFHFEL